MNSRHETEVKLRVRDARALKRRLTEMGFHPAQARHYESNQLFDFSDLRLRRAGCLVRLRTAGGRAVLTFKGPAVKSARYKIRPEIETEVEDGKRLWQILESIGLEPTFRYEKYRTTYALTGDRNQGHDLVYDETPIGNYLEIEGPQRWIDQVARQLGYSHQDYVTTSYGRLYLEYCQLKRKKPGNMVFSASKP
jgi:adenylate cyclase, class 2